MTTKHKSILDSTSLMVFFSVLFALTSLAQVLVVNRTLDPSGAGLPWPQLQMQFAYTPENGIKVLESWGPGAADRYLSVIWIDLVFALSYGPAFFLYIRRLGGSLGWCIVPLLETLTNLIETSLEMYWVAHHSADDLMFWTFMIHSIVATIKWCGLVPVYALHLAVLIYFWLRSKATQGQLSRGQGSGDPELGA